MNNAARMTCCVFSTITSRVRWSEVRDWMPQSWRVELPQSDYPRLDENITINGSCGPHPDEILMDKEAGHLGAYMFANQDDDSINAALLEIAKMNGQAADFHDKRVALELERRRQRLRNLAIASKGIT
jgi:hypothetical protein